MAEPMSTSARPQSAVRAIDEAAVEAALRRMANRSEPPWLHAEVARRMAERLRVIRRQPATLVDWWGHTGAGGTLLAEAYPKARRLVVEPSDALAERSRIALRPRWWSARRRRPAAEVLRDDPPPGAAGLVWANMMLHAVADPPALLARWQRVLEVGGFAMFSCFGPDTLRELRGLYLDQGWPPPGCEFVDMHDLGDMMIGAGFADPVVDQETLTLTWDNPQALRAELRTLGGNASPARAPGLRTPRWRERLDGALATLAGPDGRLRLSFEIVYGHAFKAAPRARMKEETVVPLDELRTMVRTRPGGRR